MNTLKASEAQSDKRIFEAFEHLKSAYDFSKKALLVQIPQVAPEFVDSRVAKKRGYFAYLPQSLFYLAAQLRAIGVESSILDLNYEVLKAASRNIEPCAEWKRLLGDALINEDLGFVCVSFMFEPTRSQLEDIIKYIKSVKLSLAVLVGGVAATSDPEFILKRTAADAVFLNEGEGPIKAFYEALNTKSDDLYNIVLKDSEGVPVWAKIKYGGDVDLDIRKEFSKVDLKNYCQVGSLNNFSRIRGLDVPYATVISRRGCRARCTFCSVRNFNGLSVRTRPATSVVDEMEFLSRNYGVKHFEWLDDDLLFDEKGIIKLFDSIAERLPDVTWAANNGLIGRFITPEIMQAMARSGCIGFGVGLESGNPGILKKIKKPINLNKFSEFCEISKNFPQIFKIVFLILGLPDERFTHMLDSYKVARESDLDWVNYFLYQPLKNTEAYVSYAVMEDETDESIRYRSTTINFNPNRTSYEITTEKNEIYTGYDIFDLDEELIPNRNQVREIWFTFNYVTNFLRHPALYSDSSVRIRNAISWFCALSEAYEGNPIIDCLIYSLENKLGENTRFEIEKLRDSALKKFKMSQQWLERDRQFCFSSLLDNQIPEIDERAVHTKKIYNY